MQKTNEKEARIAVLIDAENVSSKYIGYILDEVANFGAPTYKRIYGDFTSASLSSWNKAVKEYPLSQVQQLSYTKGKNSSDSKLIIDAMEILYSKTVDGVCIVSSDSDFTSLANKIRENGLIVIGMGEEKTPQAFVKACSSFIYLETSESFDNDPNQSPKQNKRLKNLISTLKSIVTEESDDNGWANIGPVGSVLNRRLPDFDPRSYGAKSKQLTPFIKSLDEFEVDEKTSKDPNVVAVYIRVKDKMKK